MQTAIDRFLQYLTVERNSSALTVKSYREDLQALAHEFFRTESIAVTVLGNLNGLKISRDQLAC